MNEQLFVEIGLTVGMALGSAMVGLMWSLNEKLAVIISRVDSHEKRLDHLESF